LIFEVATATTTQQFCPSDHQRAGVWLIYAENEPSQKFLAFRSRLYPTTKFQIPKFPNIPQNISKIPNIPQNISKIPKKIVGVSFCVSLFNQHLP